MHPIEILILVAVLGTLIYLVIRRYRISMSETFEKRDN
jgi:hypothetical protein